MVRAVAVSLCVAACAHHAPPITVLNGYGAQTPKSIFKVGQPYQVNGIWYYPSEDLTLDETGIASWYGPDFDQRYTANGEIFDQNQPSAAHKTLPLPSIVRVTNLDNGRSIEVRVNDRGPYVDNRIIDMSRRGAQLLGFEQAGTAKVRVQVLLPETMQAQSLAKLNGSEGTPPPSPVQAAPRQVVVAQALPPPSAPQPIPPPPAPKLIPASLPSPVPVPGSKPVPPGPTLTQAVTVLPVHPSHIFVQAGAFASNANAGKMKAKLAAIGPVVVSGVKVNGLSVYRVRLGPIPTVDQADQMLSRALGAGATQARIVVD